MKTERKWLVALGVAVVVAAGAGYFVTRTTERPPVEASGAPADWRCLSVERLVVRGGEPFSASVHLTKANCVVKATHVWVQGTSPSGAVASMEQRLDLTLSGDDVIELRDDEAHDDVAGWSWDVRVAYETARSPKLEQTFCNARDACTLLKVVTQ
ncbi:MAG: hypothetical protein ACO1OB_32165 [Archangium sp.]